MLAGHATGTSANGVLLTDLQRSALDAALAAKQAGGKAQGKGSSNLAPTDRKARNAKGLGAAKKGGAGGKFTWGKMTDGEEGVSTLDARDPNYDSDEERQVVYHQSHANAIRAEVQAYKQEVASIVEEYFLSGDVGNVARSLDDLAAPDAFGHYFVKRLVTHSLDRKDREREMASMLLSALYSEAIEPAQVAKGFTRLMDSLDDLVLDVPDAVELLALFIARAVVDDILPPAHASRAAEGAAEGSNLCQLKSRVEAHLSARHSAERMLRCWGAGAGQSHAETKERMAKILEEFCDSHDAAEASHCLRSLGVPFFHHELVKQAIWLGMQSAQQRPHLVALLARLAESGEVSGNQLLKGFQRVVDNLEDATLDNPAAQEQFAEVLSAAVAANLLEASSLSNYPATSAAPSTPTSSGTSASAPNAANGSSGGALPARTNGSGVAAYKAAAIAAVREYFDSADAKEVAARLRELCNPGLGHLFVKAAITLAMDRKPRECELVSKLLTALHPTEIDGAQIAQGFTRALAAVDDTVLDIPDAVHLLALFLGRAIVDEVLPPAFLTTALSALPDGSLGVTVIQVTGTMLSARHAAERLLACWARGGDLESVRAEMRLALAEYKTNHSVEEIARVLSDLSVPHYHHELVKDALEVAFEHPSEADHVAALLRGLSAQGVLSSTQLAQGLDRVRSRLADEALDAPGAPRIFSAIVTQAQREGWLPAEYEPGV